jgi:hypothetical protein
MATESRPRFEVSPELFPQSARALRDRGLVSTFVGLAAVLILAAAWVGWLLYGSLPLTVRTQAGVEMTIGRRTPLSLLLEFAGVTDSTPSPPSAPAAASAR